MAKKPAPLLKSAAVISILTLLSRLLGFARDVITASLFGATAGFDAFLVAFRIPNFMRGIFAEGSFSQALVPTITLYRESNPNQLKEFLAQTFGTLLISLVLITLLFELLTPVIMLAFAPGFMHDPLRYNLAMHMLWLTFPYILLISIAGFWGAIQNSSGHFVLPAFLPIILNLTLITAALWLSPFFTIGEQALAWAVLLAGILQITIQLPFIKTFNLPLRPRWGLNNSAVKELFKKFLPALLGVSMLQISLLLDTLFASFLPIGSISWLYYGDRLTFFPLGIIAVALVTPVLAHLAVLNSQRSWHQFSAAIDWGLRLMLVISLPAAIGLYLVAEPITLTLFKHGQFSTIACNMTAKSVMAFSLGIPAYMMIKLLTTAFYARHDIQTPFRLTLFAIMANVILNSLVISIWAHTGLALATSLAATGNALGLLVIALRRGFYVPVAGWMKFFLQLLFANLVMALTLYNWLPGIDSWLGWHLGQQVAHLSLWLVIAMTIYFVTLWLTGMRWHDFKQQHFVIENFRAAS